MRLFLYLLILIILENCTTVEVTKEIIKVGNTVKSSISEIVSDEDSSKDLKTNKLENIQIQNIEKEKEIITTQQSEEKSIVATQQKIVQTNFFGNSINKIKEMLGNPMLSRRDGNIYLLRYDSIGCRLFLFFKNSEENKKVKYLNFEIHLEI